jgi:acetate kinase
MQWCGLDVDPIRNTAAVGTERCISPAGASPTVYVIPVDEERLIARDARALLGSLER